MTMGTTSLTIAHKYNDIFYAVNTPEFHNCSKNILIIFESTNLPGDNFPFKDYFTNVYRIRYSPTMKRIIAAVIIIYKTLNTITKNSININYVFTSNLRLIVNQYIIKKTASSKIILLEDGVMNYKDVVFSENKKLKRTIQILLGIGEKKIQKHTLKTYLNQPTKAKHSLGIKCKLDLIIVPQQVKSLSNLLENKKIFIGGNYYAYSHLTINDYNSVVNDICKVYNIDYYMPHHFANTDEKIECKRLDINKEGITFEMLAPYLKNVSLFSLGSSIFASCKTINSSINNILIDYQNTSEDMKEGNKFLMQFCDQIIIK